MRVLDLKSLQGAVTLNTKHHWFDLLAANLNPNPKVLKTHSRQWMPNLFGECFLGRLLVMPDDFQESRNPTSYTIASLEV